MSDKDAGALERLIIGVVVPLIIALFPTVVHQLRKRGIVCSACGQDAVHH